MNKVVRRIVVVAVAGLSARNVHGYGVGSGASRRTVAPPRVRPGRPTVEGSLSPEAIRRVTLRNINQLRFCYEQTLAHTPNVQGQLVLRYVIGPQGTVPTATVVHATIAAPQISACFVSVVRRWQFPSPDGGGIATVTAPFVLSLPE